MQGLRDFLKGLDARPIPSGDPRAPQLTEGWGSLGIAAAMYDQGSWGILTDAIRRAVKDGDGRDLMALANTYADRTEDGRYTGNIMEVFYAVNCLDKPDCPGRGGLREAGQGVHRQRPHLGPVPGVGLPALRLLAHQGATTSRRRSPPRAAARSSWWAPPVTRPPRTSGPSGSTTSWPTRPDHVRRRRPHGIHAQQRVRRRRHRQLLREEVGAPRRAEVLIRFGDWPEHPYTSAPCPGTCRLSSVGQSDSLVMNRSSVRFR